MQQANLISINKLIYPCPLFIWGKNPPLCKSQVIVGAHVVTCLSWSQIREIASGCFLAVEHLYAALETLADVQASKLK